MEFAVIFGIGWVLSHAFGEKRDEYSASQEKHRERYLAKLDRNHPSWGRARREQYLRNAARRNALGHFAYLMRHGWSSTFNDFHHGWKKAKDAHEEWRAEHPKDGKKPGAWATLKAGWKDQWKKRPKATGYYGEQPRPELTPEQSDTPGAGEQPAASKPDMPPQDTSDQATQQPTGPARPDAQVINLRQNRTPGNTAGSTNRSTTVATEFNFDASKAVMNNIAQSSTGFASQLEQIQADAIVGGLKADNEAMSILSSLQEALRNAIAFSNAYIDNAGKHSGGQEYANTGHAANTDYLKSN